MKLETPPKRRWQGTQAVTQVHPRDGKVSSACIPLIIKASLKQQADKEHAEFEKETASLSLERHSLPLLAILALPCNF